MGVVVAVSVGVGLEVGNAVNVTFAMGVSKGVLTVSAVEPVSLHGCRIGLQYLRTARQKPYYQQNKAKFLLRHVFAPTTLKNAFLQYLFWAVNLKYPFQTFELLSISRHQRSAKTKGCRRIYCISSPQFTPLSKINGCLCRRFIQGYEHMMWQLSYAFHKLQDNLSPLTDPR